MTNEEFITTFSRELKSKMEDDAALDLQLNNIIDAAINERGRNGADNHYIDSSGVVDIDALQSKINKNRSGRSSYIGVLLAILVAAAAHHFGISNKLLDALQFAFPQFKSSRPSPGSADGEHPLMTFGLSGIILSASKKI